MFHNCFKAGIVVSKVVSINDNVIGDASYTREVTEGLIDLLLKNVLGTDQAKGEMQEPINTMRRVEGCVEGPGVIKFDIPIPASGIDDGEIFGSVQPWKYMI